MVIKIIIYLLTLYIIPIILNTIFILVTWLLYNKVMKNRRFYIANDQREYFDAPKKDYTAYSVLVSGALGSVFTSLISLGTFNIVLMPCVYMWLGNKEKAYEMILGSYQDAYNSLCAKLPFMRDFAASMDSLSVGLFVYNLPITLVKYFLCAAIAAMLTPLAKAFINKK